MMARVVSLFSGCGGLDIGFKDLGFELIYACDSDPAAIDCYSRNIDQHVYLRDVKSGDFHEDILHVGNCDVVLGGFPCQGFSKAGPKSETDTRNMLYTEMWQAVKKLQPAIFIAENVDGISQNFQGSYLRRILKDFNEIGYRVEYRILDAVWLGVAQHRRRTFFVGIKEELKLLFYFPDPTHELKVRNGEFRLLDNWSGQISLWDDPNKVDVNLKSVLTIKDAISDLIELDNSIPDHKVTNAWSKDYELVFNSIKQGQKLCNVRHAPTSVYTWQIPEVFGEVTERERIILETIAKNRRHKKYGNIPNGNPISIGEIELLSQLIEIDLDVKSLVAKGYLKEKHEKLDLKGAMFCSGLFKRPFWNEPSPTVLTNFHNPRYFLHPLKDRPFSLRECARLQGFPDSFIFTEGKSHVDLVSGYRLVGNAVPPPISRLFAKATLECLSKSQHNQFFSMSINSVKLMMRLPTINLDLETQLKEFDIWITPSLGEIQDTERFKKVMDNVVKIFESLATATNNFNQIDSCSAVPIADTFIQLIEGKEDQEVRKDLEALATVLFLVTGKSDNNSKCQLPLYLRDEVSWDSIPTVKNRGRNKVLSSKKIPRVLKSDSYMKTVADLSLNQAQQRRLLQEFVKFVLKDESCVSQLWSIGHSYTILKQFQKERDLLAPLVIFQIRGSVSASGGHKPEILLRERFLEWGLQAGIDFNMTDVVVEPEAATITIKETGLLDDDDELLTNKDQAVSSEVKKTRAYDFVLPFKTSGWKPRIFIQSQFYAGDSGSVSHKNIDQTDTSRNYILGFIPDARFIEYVDGAGYFSSLNGDLKKLLSKSTTTSFFQVRSAAIRLRRELEQIGFLIPLCLEQAIALSDGGRNNTEQLLLQAGYSSAEINRCLESCIEQNFVSEVNDTLLIQESRRSLVRRYFLLDVVAQSGRPADHKGELVGSIIIPGYGPFYGMRLTNLMTELLHLAPGFRNDWSSAEVIMEDINWLCDKRLAMLC
ncbi:DNA cytosine methyltransferase [Merismopedia glauca]|nr:DNA cytosine methyltransferase [Merismopedia glauca]